MDRDSELIERLIRGEDTKPSDIYNFENEDIYVNNKDKELIERLIRGEDTTEDDLNGN